MATLLLLQRRAFFKTADLGPRASGPHAGGTPAIPDGARLAARKLSMHPFEAK
jgi:hypothetical protein